MREMTVAGGESQPRDEAEAARAATTDADLVRQARRDPLAFAALYRRYAIPVFRYVHIRCGNVRDAEDLTSEVFAEGLASLPRYRERGCFVAWLFTIARRRVADYHRRARPHLPLERAEALPAGGTDPLAGLLRDERLELLRQIIAGLREDEQELLHLHFAAELTFGEMAMLLGRREAAVRQAMHRLLRQLEQRWEASSEREG